MQGGVVCLYQGVDALLPLSLRAVSFITRDLARGRLPGLLSSDKQGVVALGAHFFRLRRAMHEKGQRVSGLAEQICKISAPNFSRADEHEAFF